MGIYLNPGNEAFRISVSSEIYVDKTELISFVNKRLGQEKRFLCVSRPRRFGKSMAAHMLCAYYDRECDSRELFQDLKIARMDSFEQHLNQYDVIFLNIQQMIRAAKTLDCLIDYIERQVFREIKERYGEILEGFEETLPLALTSAFLKDKKGFIFIVDEWDCIFREAKENVEVQKKYLDFLRDLFKDRAYVKLVYMTGILPIKKYGTHSALNIFDEFSMIFPKKLAEYVGFTEIEVKQLCETFEMDFEEMKCWYDGYRFKKEIHIYNPKSIVDAITEEEIHSYWVGTETYEALKIYMDLNFDGLKDSVAVMLGGGRCRINARKFQNDMTTFHSADDILTLLVHLGYLAYNSKKKEAFIPNKEIIEEFENAMSVSGWPEVMRVLKASEKLLEDTLRGDAQSVAEMLDRAHTEVASILTYNDENSLGCGIGLAYYSARKDYKLIRELPAGKGFADIVFLPLPHTNKSAMVVELKYDRSVSAAIQQIKDRQYIQALEGYTGEILLVGVNYNKDSANKPHSCVIERVGKAGI